MPERPPPLRGGYASSRRRGDGSRRPPVKPVNLSTKQSSDVLVRRMSLKCLSETLDRAQTDRLPRTGTTRGRQPDAGMVGEIADGPISGGTGLIDVGERDRKPSHRGNPGEVSWYFQSMHPIIHGCLWSV